MVNEHDLEVGSVAEYIEKFALQGGTVFYNQSTNIMPLFRGQANKNWSLCPSVYRNSQFYLETNYLREMERMIPTEFEGFSYIEKMIKMQHYGLPTRLLDFTLNPLVALFFACNESTEDDGVVYCIHGTRLHPEDFVWISIAMKAVFEYPLTNFDINNFIKELQQNPIAYPTRDVEDFYKKESLLKILTNPIGVYPRLRNNRLQRQDGVFVLFGMRVRELLHDDRIVFDSVVYEKISDLSFRSFTCIIPASQKQSILRDLDYLGINERSLFPDIGSLAKYIPQYISRRRTI